MKAPLFALLLLALAACQQAESPLAKTEPAELILQPAQTERGINVVIEIPAGTNRKIEYDKDSRQFKTDQRDGQDRIIDFLPYPGNYGFIPSTLMGKAEGGDGDALDVLLLAETLPTGSLVEAIPIGALKLMDEGELDTKIIAIPVDTSLQIIRPSGYQDFSIRYDGAKHIIESWFLYYDGLGQNTFAGWMDEKEALEAVKRWSVDQ